jgi:hypothetical protein
MKRFKATILGSSSAIRWLTLVIGLASVLSSPASAQSAQVSALERQPIRLANNVSGKVEIELMVVHASNASERVDPQLQPVMQHLRFLSFKGFKMLSKESKGIGVGQDHVFSVAGGRRVKVKLVDRDSSRAKIRIEMFNAKNKILDTTVSIHRNKSFMVAGPKHEGGVLVLPVTARY